MTTPLLRDLLSALQGALGPAGLGLADSFGRYDGEPADAVDEHVVDLQSASGASVLVGFLSDDVAEADEDGVPIRTTVRPGVVVVRRRGPRDGASGTTVGATEDAEALDALYDAAAAACQSAGWRVLRGRALAGDVRDWFARAIVVERDRPDWP